MADELDPKDDEMIGEAHEDIVGEDDEEFDDADADDEDEGDDEEDVEA